LVKAGTALERNPETISEMKKKKWEKEENFEEMKEK
jgi:IS4 transposase